MQTSAVQLAFDQHRAERESADVLVNLGRRNQNLLKRTLGYISELEADETDPEVLSRLFRLDHATTRIRRNAESMLVLAGAEQTRTWSQPVPIAEAARAALSEIEDYQRVDLHHLDEAAVTGVAVADLVHLIAELAENATHFSPPGSRVTVVGQHVADGYRIQVSDRGVGMSASELDGANARIARAAEGRSDSPLLGLYVVGRLAARRGITVALEPSAGSGITASVTLPPSMLVDTASLTRTPAETPALPSPAAGPWPVVPNASVPHRGRPARGRLRGRVEGTGRRPASRLVRGGPAVRGVRGRGTVRRLDSPPRPRCSATRPRRRSGTGLRPARSRAGAAAARRAAPRHGTCTRGASRRRRGRPSRTGGRTRLPAGALMAQPTLSAAAQNVNWLLDRFVRDTDAVERAAGVSSDGLLIAISPPLASSQADKLAATISGLTSLALSASHLLRKDALRQVIIELEGGFLLVSAVRDGSCLGVVTGRGADLALVGYETAMLAHRVGSLLTPDLITELKTSVPRW